jgi:O-antigen/teichoic acid export membrane protein
MGGHAATQVLRFGSNLVMTRLLLPDSFGVMALALTFMYALNMFSDIGLRMVAVQHARGGEKRFLDVLWTVQVLRGVLIMVVGLVCAAAVWSLNGAGLTRPGSAYAHPDLPGVLVLLAVGMLISGFESTKLISMGRELNLKKTVLLEIYAQLFGFAVMVSIAWLHPTVYALAAGAIANAVFKTALSHTWMDGYANRFGWETAIWRDIYRFGRWIFLSSILGFLIAAGDKIILGGLLSATDFGIYAIAVIIVGIVHELGNKISASVAYPALSEVQRERPEALRETYYKLRLPLDAVAFTSAGFLWAAGHQIIDLLYRDQYLQAGMVVQILAVSLVVVGVNTSGNVYMAVGKPWLVSMLMCVRLAGLIIAVPVLAQKYGLAGAGSRPDSGFCAGKASCGRFRSRPSDGGPGRCCRNWCELVSAEAFGFLWLPTR